MPFPNFERKHSERAHFSPKDFVKYGKYGSAWYPKKFIICYNRKIYQHARQQAGFEQSKEFTSNKVGRFSKTGILFSRGIGAPNIVTIVEELIALGVKEFISIGTAGGLQKPGFFVCEKALRDEGTSSHYLAHTPFSYPDKKLTDKLLNELQSLGVNPVVAPSWTTDAPYRETTAELTHYRNKGIVTVEMEASALFALAKYRKVKIAAAFVVSDLLVGKWDPQFHSINVKQGLITLFYAAKAALD